MMSFTAGPFHRGLIMSGSQATGYGPVAITVGVKDAGNAAGRAENGMRVIGRITAVAGDGKKDTGKL